MQRALLSTLASLALAGALAGCGGDDSGNGAGGLTFIREDGSTFEITEAEVSCGSSVATDSGEQAIIIGRQEPPTQRPDEPFLVLEGALADVEEGATIELPSSYSSSDPSGGLLFVYDSEERNELSSADEGSSGTLDFADVSCSPPEATVTADGTLGSEASDGEPVSVSGTLHASGGE